MNPPSGKSPVLGPLVVAALLALAVFAAPSVARGSPAVPDPAGQATGAARPGLDAASDAATGVPEKQGGTASAGPTAWPGAASAFSGATGLARLGPSVPFGPGYAALPWRPSEFPGSPGSVAELDVARRGVASTPREGRLSWPLSPVPAVLRYFDAPETPYGAGHRGVDLAAVPGQDVLAADAGVVVFAGLVAGRPVVSVDHDGGLRTTYEPVQPGVAAGDQVYRGQVLGTVLAGHPGCLVAACLHWGVRRGADYVDPLSLVGELGDYRLKPWEPG